MGLGRWEEGGVSECAYIHMCMCMNLKCVHACYETRLAPIGTLYTHMNCQDWPYRCVELEVVSGGVEEVCRNNVGIMSECVD